MYASARTHTHKCAYVIIFIQHLHIHILKHFAFVSESSSSFYETTLDFARSTIFRICGLGVHTVILDKLSGRSGTTSHFYGAFLLLGVYRDSSNFGEAVKPIHSTRTNEPTSQHRCWCSFPSLSTTPIINHDLTHHHHASSHPPSSPITNHLPTLSTSISRKFSPRFLSLTSASFSSKPQSISGKSQLLTPTVGRPGSPTKRAAAKGSASTLPPAKLQLAPWWSSEGLVTEIWSSTWHFNG